jgi:hypothetical protein
VQLASSVTLGSYSTRHATHVEEVEECASVETRNAKPAAGETAVANWAKASIIARNRLPQERFGVVSYCHHREIIAKNRYRQSARLSNFTKRPARTLASVTNSVEFQIINRMSQVAAMNHVLFFNAHSIFMRYSSRSFSGMLRADWRERVVGYRDASLP